MKIELTEARNTATSPGCLRMWYVGNADDLNGDDRPNNIGRIFISDYRHQPRALHEFRPDEGCPDLDAEALEKIAVELRRLDRERADWMARQ